MPIQIYIVDADRPRRERLASALRVSDDFAVAGTGAGIDQAIDAVASGRQPDILLITVDDPEMRTPRSWARLRSGISNEVRLAVLTSGEDARTLEVTVAAGPSALHLIDIEADRLRSALRTVARGEVDFDPKLVERAKELLIERASHRTVAVGGLVIDPKYRRVTRWGTEVDLSELEFRVLFYLASRKGEYISSGELLRAGWGTSFGKGGTDDQVRSLIKRLRTKIEPNPHFPRYVRSSRGRGYCLQELLKDSPQ